MAEQDPEEDDELNSYFLEVGSPSASGYGGIDEVRLQRGAVEILLSEANRYGDGIRRIAVSFECSAPDFDELQKYMCLIFKDSDCHFSLG